MPVWSGSSTSLLEHPERDLEQRSEFRISVLRCLRPPPPTQRDATPEEPARRCPRSSAPQSGEPPCGPGVARRLSSYPRLARAWPRREALGPVTDARNLG